MRKCRGKECIRLVAADHLVCVREMPERTLRQNKVLESVPTGLLQNELVLHGHQNLFT